MKLTMAWLKKQGACSDGVDWFMAFGKTDSVEVMNGLLEVKKHDWANWLIVRLLDRKNHIRYAIFAAEQVIDLFEKKYPEDKRPRLAIDAAKAVLENDTEATRNAAGAAWDAAWAAWATGDAAGDAARAAGNAARAAWADWAAEDAARAAWSAGDAGDAMKEKIIRYGLELHVKGER